MRGFPFGVFTRSCGPRFSSCQSWTSAAILPRGESICSIKDRTNGSRRTAAGRFGFGLGRRVRMVTVLMELWGFRCRLSNSTNT